MYSHISYHISMNSLQSCHEYGGYGIREKKPRRPLFVPFSFSDGLKWRDFLIMNKVVKNIRLDVCKCTTAPIGHAFHLGCLGRNSAGANAKKLYVQQG